MISFELTPEQEAIRKMAGDFAKNEISPVAAHYDHTAEVPWPVMKKAFEVGLMNLTVPEEYGGAGLGVLESCLVGEEMSAGCAGISASIAINDIACSPIVLAGTREQKKRFLEPVCRDMKMVCICITEPGAGSDVASISTTAKKVGGEYVLNGTKQFISNASIADYFVVFASTDKSKKHKGISAFVIPKETDGISAGKKEDKMGQRASNTAQVILEEVVVPETNRLGQEGDGFKLIMKVFNKSRPGVASSAVGVARAAMEHARRYAMQRAQFGMPIIMNQSIMFMLVDMDKDIDAARLLAWRAAWLADRGLPNAKEAAMAKAFAADMCMNVTTNAVQVFGGYGYSREYPVEKLMRDAKVMQIYEGTSQIQRLLIAKTYFSW